MQPKGTLLVQQRQYSTFHSKTEADKKYRVQIVEKHFGLHIPIINFHLKLAILNLIQQHKSLVSNKILNTSAK